MWTDPKYTLELARERQREIACQVDARRSVSASAPALDEVAHTWVAALRMTGAYLRAINNGSR